LKVYFVLLTRGEKCLQTSMIFLKDQQVLQTVILFRERLLFCWNLSISEELCFMSLSIFSTFDTNVRAPSLL